MSSEQSRNRQLCEYEEMWDKSNCTFSLRNKVHKVAKPIPKNSRRSALGLVVLETVSLSDVNTITGYEYGVSISPDSSI